MLIMIVQDIKEFAHVDGVVVLGVNPEFDGVEPRQIESIVRGKELSVIRPDGAVIRAFAKSVDVSVSLAGRRNIALVFPPHLKDEILVGSEVRIV